MTPNLTLAYAGQYRSSSVHHPYQLTHILVIVVAWSILSPVSCPMQTDGYCSPVHPACHRPGPCAHQQELQPSWGSPHNPPSGLPLAPASVCASIYSRLVQYVPCPNRALAHTYGCCSLSQPTPPHDPVHTYANSYKTGMSFFFFRKVAISFC